MAFKQPRRRKGKGTTLHASTVSQPSKNQHLQPKKSNPPSKRGPGFMTGRKRGYRSGDYLDHRAVSSQSQRQSGFGTRGGIAIMQSNRNKNQRNSSSSIDINPLEIVEDQRRQQLHNFGVPNDTPLTAASKVCDLNLDQSQNESDSQEEWHPIGSNKTSNKTVEIGGDSELEEDNDNEKDNANDAAGDEFANEIIKNMILAKPRRRKRKDITSIITGKSLAKSTADAAVSQLKPKKLILPSKRAGFMAGRKRTACRSGDFLDHAVASHYHQQSGSGLRDRIAIRTNATRNKLIHLVVLT